MKLSQLITRLRGLLKLRGPRYPSLREKLSRRVHREEVK